MKKLITLSMLLTAAQLSVAQPQNDRRVWVEYSSNKADEVRALLNNSGATLHYHFDNLKAYAASVPAAAMAGLSRNPNIKLIEEDPERYPLAQTVPYGVDAVQASAASASGTVTGNGRTVCIIDSGLSVGHEDFAGVSVIGGYPDNWNTDSCGHGTHVAGTIAAANNESGVVGVAPGASLYIIKVFDGPACGWAYSSDLVDAANHCQTAGANIISMSLGGSIRSRTEDRAFSRLYKDGLLSVAAAGNDGNTRNSYPASYSDVISVAATDHNKVIADFSQQNSQVELAAPGVGVLSTVPFLATNTLTVGGAVYSGQQIAFAAYADSGVQGTIVDGGLCDSAGAWSGNVVMCERGDISFYDKVLNAQNGGGAAVVIYNNVAGGFSGTLGDGNSSTIPAISLSQADGQAIIASSLAASGTVISRLESPASGYEAWSGTSMATPHVSGVAALIWSADRNKTNAEVRDALTLTALDLGAPGRDPAYGYGLVQADAALQVLAGNSAPSNNFPIASFSEDCSGLSCSFDASASSDSDGSIVAYQWDFGDGNTGSGSSITHIYANGGSKTVTLTVTDNDGDSQSAQRTVNLADSTGDIVPPVISDVATAKLKGTQFQITWTTDEPATSIIRFTCCGEYSDSNFKTEHSMNFRGNKGESYTITITATDAAGNSRESESVTHQN